MFGWLFGRDEYGRSGQWQRVRREHLEREPACAACGRRKDLEVHHVLPYHKFPELELEPSNLLTLCNSPCHLVFGHLMNWRRTNSQVRNDAARYLQRVLTEALQD